MTTLENDFRIQFPAVALNDGKGVKVENWTDFHNDGILNLRTKLEIKHGFLQDEISYFDGSSSSLSPQDGLLRGEYKEGTNAAWQQAVLSADFQQLQPWAPTVSIGMAQWYRDKATNGGRDLARGTGVGELWNLARAPLGGPYMKSPLVNNNVGYVPGIELAWGGKGWRAYGIVADATPQSGLLGAKVTDGEWSPYRLAPLNELGQNGVYVVAGAGIASSNSALDAFVANANGTTNIVGTLALEDSGIGLLLEGSTVISQESDSQYGLRAVASGRLNDHFSLIASGAYVNVPAGTLISTSPAEVGSTTLCGDNTNNTALLTASCEDSALPASSENPLSREYSSAITFGLATEGFELGGVDVTGSVSAGAMYDSRVGKWAPVVGSFFEFRRRDEKNF